MLWSLKTPVKPFRAPNESIGPLDAATASTLLAKSSDVALVLDRAGVIQDMAVQPMDLSSELEGYGRWFGRMWSETVSADSRPKVEDLLDEARKNTTSRWRQLTHRSISGQDVPILYSTVKVGAGDHVIALGRDLRAVATLQQRLVEAQMSMERDYAKLRAAETRYRLLFQVSSEPVLVLDGSNKVLEANPAATAWLGIDNKRVIGRSFADLFAGVDRPKVQALLGDLRGAARGSDMSVSLPGGEQARLSVMPFRQEGAPLQLVRLSTSATMPGSADPSEQRLADLAQMLPDALLIADASGRVLAANAAFAELVQVDPAALVDRTLDSWLGCSGVDLDIMMTNLRQHGTMRLFPTLVRGADGDSIEVEVSAVALGRGKDETYGFTIREIGRRLQPAPRVSQGMTRSAEQLTELIGRVPLKELVRETTDVIEKLCIETALDVTGDNRASAAELLGLSRQSLYVKLRRYGLADVGVEEDA